MASPVRTKSRIGKLFERDLFDASLRPGSTGDAFQIAATRKAVGKSAAASNPSPLFRSNVVNWLSRPIAGTKTDKRD
jgi:hypothetical protein